MKKCSALACMFMLMVVFFAAPAPAQTAPDKNAAKKFVDAQMTIEKLRQQKNVDWKAVQAQFEITEPVVIYTDKTFGTGYDKEIRASIANCAAGGKDCKVSQQYLAKGLQHVNIINMRDLLKKAGNNKGSVDVLAAFFEGIRPTLVRRDKDYYNGTPTLEKEAADAIPGLRAAGPQFISASRSFTDAIDRAYALSMLGEIKELEEFRTTNPAACPGKVAEATVFYRVIQSRVAKRSPRDNAFIETMLKANYSAMSVKDLEKALKAGLAPAKLR